jgi:N-acyl-L-homoserine lactone synthetase
VRTLPIIERVTPEDPLFTEWLLARQMFMERQGWTSGNDMDAYDLNPQTIQLLNMNAGVIESGLRLTPHQTIEDTMSWSWLPDELKERALPNLPDAPHGVWDLTRLVPGDATPDRAAASLVELFGAGYELTKQEGNDPRWIFATTQPFLRYFQQQGIEFTPIVKGKFSANDKFNSVLCYADPAHKTTLLHESLHEGHQRTYAAVVKGMAAVGLREVMDS